MSKEKIRIALISVRAANAMPSWQGVMHSMARALRESGAEVVCIELEDGLLGKLFLLKEFFVRRIIGRRYQRHREPWMLSAYGRAMDRTLVRYGVDVGISLKAIPMSRSRTLIPLILYNDAPFSGLLNFYAEFSGMSRGHIAVGHAMEAGTARKAARSVYTSQWAADLAVADYGVDASTVHVIPIGANLDIYHTRADVERYIRNRAHARCWHFLWLGVDWERKRGAMAVEIVRQLRQRGYDVHLTVAGASPGRDQIPSDIVTAIPFLSSAEIMRMLEDVHFLLLPTIADCTPVVYSEANAFGVPVLSTLVGGIATSITDGVNGCLFAVDALAEVWVERIIRFIEGKDAYTQLALTSYDAYVTRLNWHVAGRRLREIVDTLHSS